MALVQYTENVDDDYLVIKFDYAIQRTSISNPRFTVYESGASPTSITDPFKTINLNNDWNSLSRRLVLYWNDSKLSAGTTYDVEVSGLKDAVGETFATETFSFTTPDPFATVFVDPTPTPVVVEDKSIKTGVFTGATTLVLPSDGFWIEDVTPDRGSSYLAEGENNGVIEIEFSSAILDSFLTSTYFKVQKKEIKFGPSRWSTVTPVLSRSGAVVSVQLPSTDATPVYNTADKIYFEAGYKYRVIVSKNVGIDESSTPSSATTYTLGTDQELLFLSELDPAYIDPEDLVVMFPEASSAEALESVHRVSLEVKAWYKGTVPDPMPGILYEYMIAAAACDLSQRYGYGCSDEYQVTLGDLSVTNRSMAKGAIYRDNATTWCEIAASMRKEVSMLLAGMRSVVRGSDYCNPMPMRSIYVDPRKKLGYHNQGTLDDVTKPPSSF